MACQAKGREVRIIHYHVGQYPCMSFCALWRGCVSLAGPIVVLPSWQQPSALRSTASSSHAPQTIVPPVVTPPRPPRVQDQSLLRCVPGAN
jgi:hypothetical protein